MHTERRIPPLTLTSDERETFSTAGGGVINIALRPVTKALEPIPKLPYFLEDATLGDVQLNSWRY